MSLVGLLTLKHKNSCEKKNLRQQNDKCACYLTMRQVRILTPCTLVTWPYRTGHLSLSFTTVHTTATRTPLVRSITTLLVKQFIIYTCILDLNSLKLSAIPTVNICNSATFIIHFQNNFHIFRYNKLIWCGFDRASSLIFGNNMLTRSNRWFLLQILLLAQHVSGTTMPIIRSSRVIYRRLLPVVFGTLVFKLSVWCGAEGYVSGLRAA
jgi:hypothetical protein